MSLNGIRTVHNILIAFLLIGVMTALWRMAGTIPFIVCHATKLIRPFAFLLMTNQLCGDLYADRGKLAIDLEDTAVVVAPLIPWSIAGTVPLAAAGAPLTAILASFYLIILPIYRLGWSQRDGSSGSIFRKF